MPASRSAAVILLAIGLVVAAAPGVDSRPASTPGPMILEYSPDTDGFQLLSNPRAGILAAWDTTYYGGTVWAADSNRWEALRGGVWAFNSGVGSNFTEPTQAPKPPGYLHRAEGWHDLDLTYARLALPYFRRSGPGLPDVPGVSVNSTCVISGAASMWAGLTLAESSPLCYANGQGYGNDWSLTLAKTLNVSGPGNATLSFQYSVESESSYDYFRAFIDTTGVGSRPDVAIAGYSGVVSGTANLTLVRGATLRSTPGPVTLKFLAASDEADSDEDGGISTACGLAIVDNIVLSGALTENATFETGNDGWVQSIATSGEGGAWMNLRALSSLPPPLTFCPCSMSDSVMVFFDLQNQHHMTEDNIAVSPWCDLRAGGDVGRPGKFIQFEGYFDLYLVNYVLVQTMVSWYPEVCPNTGLVYTKPLTSDGFYRFFGGSPNCITGGGTPIRIDYSAIIPPWAEQVRIAVGIYNRLCLSFAGCTGVSNSTPWFDNVRLGVYGTAGGPIISMRTADVLQDSFARDGTLNPASAARVDVNTVKGSATPAPGSALGDSIVVVGDGGNQEVRVVFRIRSGPFLNASLLSAWAAAKWTPEPAAGPGWYSARMDSAEQGGVKTTGRWMGTLHEQDPNFGGGSDTDRGAEGDPNQLSHDIFPDNILTAGSRIDYFVKARYLPPDPRNPGGAAWTVFPDTTNGRYLEMEVLPSSYAADTTWNCVLYVDHRNDRDFTGQVIDEQGLTTALGSGGNTAEGTRFDRYDVQAPSSQQASLGRPLNTQYGAGIQQVYAYNAVVWNSGNLTSFNLMEEDANILAPFLTIDDVGGRRFWGSGDGLVRSMHSEAEPSTLNFLNTICGVRFQCDTIRISACPTGSVLDSTFCLPLSPVAGAHFATAGPANARGNGCPDLRSFDVLIPNTSVPTATRQLTYQKSGAPLVAPYAMAVANYNTVGVDYKTVLDGVGSSQLREANGNTHAPARCNITAPAIQRTVDILDWFRQPTTFGICRPLPISGMDHDEGPGGAQVLRSALRAVTPNPMSVSVQIRYANAKAQGRVRIDVVDVTGRLVRRLLDADQDRGAFAAVWDGRDDRGKEVVRGLYFVTLTTVDVRESKKVIVAR